MKRALLTTVLCSVMMMTSACKKKDAATADNAGDKAGDRPKPGDMKPAAGGEMTPADYEAKDVAMMDKAIALFGAAGTDCDKAAAAVGSFFDDNKASMEALETFEKAHPDVKKQVEDKYKDKSKAFEDSIGKVMESCKDNKAMQDAMKKIPG